MQKSFSFYQASLLGINRDRTFAPGRRARASRTDWAAFPMAFSTQRREDAKERRDFPMSPTPPRLLFEVASCDHKPANSSNVGWNMMLHIVFHSQKPTETTSKSSHVPKPAPLLYHNPKPHKTPKSHYLANHATTREISNSFQGFSPGFP